MKNRPAAVTLALVALGVADRSADLRVGADVPTIREAIKRAQPGDTIHLQPIVYRDYAGFYGKKGEPGKPITLDGHGATLEGSDPIDPAQWKEVAPGLFAHDHLLPRNDTAIMGRWFFLWNGRMNHMGRTSKGRQEPFKKPEDLQPNEWTFVRDPAREQPPSSRIDGTFYLKLPPGRKLAEARISAPLRSAGVQLSGDNAHLVIRNLTATHPYNDGFNIHGDCRDVVFENIRAIECGDDGISAHESAEYRVDGLISMGNSTGITDTVAARTSYNRVFLADNLGYDLFFLDNGRYRLTNAIVLSTAQNPFSLTGREDGRAELDIDNVLIRRLGGHSSPAQVAKTAALRARRLTLQNLPFEPKGEVHLDHCVLDRTSGGGAGDPDGADVPSILKSFGDEMLAEALRGHSSYLLARAVNRAGAAPVPVVTAPDHCAWPNLKLLSGGALAALIFNNASHGHHPGDIECWRSGDGGASWGFAGAATAHEPDTIRMNHAAGLAKNGDLLVLAGGWSNRYPEGIARVRGSFRYEVLRPWLSRSTDGGRSWVVSREAFPAALPSGQNGTPFGDMVVARNGDLCVGVYGTLDPLDKYEDRRFRSWLYRSKDDGKTWGEPVVIGPEHNETNIIHLGEGRWLACARGGTGVEGRDFMDLFASSDDARSWSRKGQLTGFQRVNGHLLKLNDGRVVFTYGDRAAAAGRKGLEAKISGDGGATWSAPVRLVDWNGLDGGYPSSVQRSDGQVVTAYYASALDGQPADSMKGYHMAAIVWDPARTFAALP
jgi:hypothetical protein